MFTAPDGVTVRAHLWPGDTIVEPIVLHHGFAASTASNWVGTGILDAILATGRTVVGVDARGHGESDKPHESSFYGEATMAADLIGILDALGAPKVHLVGYSMGSIVSLIAAARDDRIARLVVGGVGAGVVELGGLDMRAMPPGELAPALLADDASTVENPMAAGFRRVAEASGADLAALAAQLGAVHQQPIDLRRITARTLVIAGDADPLAARPSVLADAVPGAALETFGGDHLSVLRNPDFIASLVAFVDESSVTD